VEPLHRCQFLSYQCSNHEESTYNKEVGAEEPPAGFPKRDIVTDGSEDL
jgi:hypothetical protein